MLIQLSAFLWKKGINDMITYGSITLTSYNTITKIEVYYYKSTSATDLAGGSWSTTKPTWENGKYIWQKIKTTYEGKLENGQFYSESDPVNITGQQGATGTAAYSYKLNASDSVIGKTKTGEYTIDKITFTATYKQGTGAVTAYTGRFKIETTANGTTWTTQYTSSGNESSKEYTIPEDIISIRCSLYQSGGTSTLLDIVTIPVVKDGIDAVGLRDSIPYYLASDKQTGVTRLDQGWTRFKPELTTEKRYLWAYYVSRYSEGDTQPELIEIKNDIVSFENHGDESPVESCVIDIEPVQDLHGQSSPYPAGGGKNILDLEAYIASRISNYTVDSDGWITFSPNKAGVYTNKWNVGSLATRSAIILINSTTTVSNIKLRVYNGTTVVAATAGGNPSFAKIENKEFDTIGFNWSTAADTDTVTIKVAVVNGSSIDAWSPYENICPITGWTGAQVVRTGVNVWDEEWEVGNIASNGQPNSNDKTIRSKNFCRCLPNTTYYCTCGKTDGGNQNRYYVAIFWYDENENFLNYDWCNNLSVTSPSNAQYFKTCTNTSTVVYGDTYNHDISINYPATDHDYHPYTGNTYSITFPTEAGTVYGGELDVTSGVLTVDRAMVDLGDYDWIMENDPESLPGTARAAGHQSLFNIYVYNQYPVCSVLKGDMPKSYRQVEEGCICFSNSEAIPMIRVRSQAFVGLTNEELKTALSGAQCCLKIREPITYTLTPQEITMLTGQNHIFSDTGQTAISYYDNQTSTNPYVDYSATSAFEVADKAWAATQPLAIKTYNDVTITANNDPKGWLYFGTVKPTDYNTPWKIRYKVYASINGVTDSYQQSEVMIEGAKDTYYTYRTYNMISNTNYRPLYAYSLYTLKQAGVNNGYGHLIGIRFQSAYWPNSTYTNYKRTIKIEIIESTNCQITLADTMFLYTDASGTGSTNYNTRYSFDGTTQGYSGSGDRNETNHILNNFSGKTGVLGIWQTGLFMRDGNGTYQNICTNANGAISRTVETTKKPNPNGFEIGSQIYYSASSYNANSNITSSVYASYGAFDSRYSLNTTLTANCLTPYQPVYLVGTIRTNGLFYLDTVWWTQTATDSSKVYILIGGCYDSTTSYCRINLYEQNNWFKYVDGKLVDYTNRLAELAASTATAYITDTTDNGIMVHPENDTTSGWSIAGAIELFKTGISYIKLWIDNNIPKIRIGKEDSKHVLIDNDSVNIVDDDTTLASFGEVVVVGQEANDRMIISPTEIYCMTKNNQDIFRITHYSSGVETGTDFQITNETSQYIPKGSLNRFVYTLSYVPKNGTMVTWREYFYDSNYNELNSQSGSKIYNYTPSSNTINVEENDKIIEDDDGWGEAVSEPATGFEDRPQETVVITEECFYPHDGLTIGVGTSTSAVAYVKFIVSYTSQAVNQTEQIYYTFGKRKNDYEAGKRSFVIGYDNTAIGNDSFAEGYNNIASGDNSHAEGSSTEASGYNSHTEGFTTVASGNYAHAEGYDTLAYGSASHAEGRGTEARDSYTHAEGWDVIADGLAAHAEGCDTEAYGNYSHTQNRGTIASSFAQTTLGRWNIEDKDNIYAVIIGNGSDDDNRSNALAITWDGDTKFALDTTASSGTIDANLYDAITALGWENDVTA